MPFRSFDSYKPSAEYPQSKYRSDRRDPGEQDTDERRSRKRNNEIPARPDSHETSNGYPSKRRASNTTAHTTDISSAAAHRDRLRRLETHNNGASASNGHVISPSGVSDIDSPKEPGRRVADPKPSRASSPRSKRKAGMASPVESPLASGALSRSGRSTPNILPPVSAPVSAVADSSHFQAIMRACEAFTQSLVETSVVQNAYRALKSREEQIQDDYNRWSMYREEFVPMGEDQSRNLKATRGAREQCQGQLSQAQQAGERAIHDMAQSILAACISNSVPLAEHEDALKQLTSELQAESEKSAALSKKTDDAMKQLESKQTEDNATLERKTHDALKQLESKLEAQSEESATSRKEYADALNQLTNKLQAQNEEITTLRKDNVTLKNDNAALRKDNATFKKDVADLEQSVDNTRSDYGILVEVTGRQERALLELRDESLPRSAYREAETKNKQRDSDVSTLSENLAALTSKQDELKRELKSEIPSQIEVFNANIKAEIKAETEKHSRTDDERLSKLESDFPSLKQEFCSWRQTRVDPELASARQAVQELKDQTEAQESAIQRLDRSSRSWLEAHNNLSRQVSTVCKDSERNRQASAADIRHLREDEKTLRLRFAQFERMLDERQQGQSLMPNGDAGIQKDTSKANLRREEIEGRLNGLSNDIGNMKEVDEKAAIAVEVANEEVVQMVGTMVDEFNDRIIENEELSKGLEKDISDLRERLDGYSLDDNKNRSERLEKEIVDLRGQLDRYSANQPAVSASLRQINADMVTFKSDIDNAEAKRTALQNICEQVQSSMSILQQQMEMQQPPQQRPVPAVNGSIAKDDVNPEIIDRIRALENSQAALNSWRDDFTSEPMLQSAVHQLQQMYPPHQLQEVGPLKRRQEQLVRDVQEIKNLNKTTGESVEKYRSTTTQLEIVVRDLSLRLEQVSQHEASKHTEATQTLKESLRALETRHDTAIEGIEDSHTSMRTAIQHVERELSGQKTVLEGLGENVVESGTKVTEMATKVTETARNLKELEQKFTETGGNPWRVGQRVEGIGKITGIVEDVRDGAPKQIKDVGPRVEALEAREKSGDDTRPLQEIKETQIDVGGPPSRATKVRNDIWELPGSDNEADASTSSGVKRPRPLQNVDSVERKKRKKSHHPSGSDEGSHVEDNETITTPVSTRQSTRNSSQQQQQGDTPTSERRRGRPRKSTE